MSYHICTPCNDFNIYIIQDALFLNHQVSRPAHYVYVIIDLTLLLCNVGVYFELNGERYDNNSMVNILAIGIGNSALLCKTNKQDCCGTVPNRLGEFYYPHGGQVSIYITGDGFYCNRGHQVIRLNRRDGISSPTGS